MTNGFIRFASKPILKLIDELKSRGVETIHILSRAAAYVMERVDLVICGAEAVVESGAVVSQLGTYSMAIAAHVHKELDTDFNNFPLLSLNFKNDKTTMKD